MIFVGQNCEPSIRDAIARIMNVSLNVVHCRFGVPPAAAVPDAHAGLAQGLREHGGVERGGHASPLGVGRQEAHRHGPILQVSFMLGLSHILTRLSTLSKDNFGFRLQFKTCKKYFIIAIF